MKRNRLSSYASPSVYIPREGGPLPNTPATITKMDVSGVVRQLYCQRPTFCAGLLELPNRSTLKFKIKGYVRPGQNVKLRGEMSNDVRFGRQFDADEVIYELPVDTRGLSQWLAWNVQSVGPAIATKLTDEFGTDLMPLCIADPGQVAATCGLPIELIEGIAREWQNHSSKIAVQSKLAGFGLTQHQVESIVAKFGGSAATVIEDNPYILLGEVEGLGFAKIDEIALKSGMTKSDPRRAMAAMFWTVKQGHNDDGHTAMDRDDVIAKAETLLGGETFDTAAATAMLMELGKVTSYAASSGRHYLSTPAADKAERFLFDWFARSRDENAHAAELAEHLAGDVTITIGSNTVTLDDTQADAVRLACRHRCTVITGGAGAGKTLVARAVAVQFSRAGVAVHLVAPTGKAARRLTEVVGLPAATIHRTLGYSPDGGFTYGKDNPLPEGLYLVDEISMADSGLMAAMLQAMPVDAVVVMIGDENQLPPVGAGAVLRDVIAHQLVPAARLMKCHRQAGPLKANAAAVNAGEIAPSHMDGTPPPWIVHGGLNDADAVIRAVRTLFEKHLSLWGFDPVSETQFMTAIHKGKIGTKFLNRYLQWLNQKHLAEHAPRTLPLNHDYSIPDEPTELDDRRPTLYVGDKVIHVKNNYQLGVMNGTVGIVLTTSPLRVNYDDGIIEYSDDTKGQVELAYCLTPHKMQGSEIPCAVAICAKANSFIQTRNWLYTAATRARKTCVIIGDTESQRRAAGRTDANRRSTLLGVLAVDNSKGIGQ